MYKIYTKILCWADALLPKIWLIMRLTTFLLIVTMMQVSANGFAQRLSYHQKNVSLKQVFKEIKNQTGFDVIWKSNAVNASRKIDAQFSNSSLENVIQVCLQGMPLSYEIDEKTILIKEDQPSLLNKVVAIFSDIDVRGRVVDEQGIGLPGATVRLKSKNNMTAVTNADGLFLFADVAPGKYQIDISFMGYQTYNQTMMVDKDMQLIIVMKPVSKVLDETVIKGYYNTTRRLNTGNVSSVKADELQRQTVNDPILALEGLVPGLSVQQTSGLPGSQVNVKIRGASSIQAGTRPLYIVDGIPFNGQRIDQQTPNGSQFTSQPNGGSDPLNLINPQDIESVEVLKDADATSIYGSRGQTV